MRIAATIARASIVAGLVACDTGTSRTAGTAEASWQYDSLGISIVVTPQGVARRATRWIIDSIPNLQIGMESGEEPYQFHNIRGIRGLPNGRIALVDGGSRQLRLFDTDGLFLRAFGKRGRGPGEFLSPRLVPSLMSDELIVWEASTQRFTVFTARQAGDSMSISPVPTHFLPGGQVPVGASGYHVLTFDPGVMFIGSGGLHEKPERADFRVIHAVTGAIQILGEFRGRQMLTDTRSPNAVLLPVPFNVRPGGAAGQNGFFINPATGPYLLEYDTPRSSVPPSENSLMQVRRIMRVDEPVEAVTQSDLDAFVDKEIARQPADQRAAFAPFLRERYKGLPLAPVMPSFESLRVDELGWLWARLYDPLGKQKRPLWMVFDTDGKACGTVAVPADLDIHHIGPDFILGHWRDDLGVEYIRRHRLLNRTSGRAC